MASSDLGARKPAAHFNRRQQPRAMEGYEMAAITSQENGLMMDNWMTVHELFHDGRHALGFPCH